MVPPPDEQSNLAQEIRVKLSRFLLGTYIATSWPSSHYLVPIGLQLTICEILCVTSTIIPKDVQKHLVQQIILLLMGMGIHIFISCF